MLSAAHLVRETNSATGTSAFVLTGAVSGYRTVATGYGSDARLVPYVARTTSGTLQFEVGIGQFDGTTGITRFAKGVLDGSSGSGTLVDFASAPEIYVDAGAFAIPGLDPGTGGRRPFVAHADFLNASSSAATADYSTVVSGGGVGWTRQTGGMVGVAVFHTGTSSSGLATFQFAIGNAATWDNAILFGNGAAIFEALVKVPVVSDGTNTFTVRCGFLQATSSDGSEGAHFICGGSLANSNWWFQTIDNSTMTGPTDSGVAVSTTGFQRLRVEVCPDGSRADFFIDGANVGHVTTNIPTAAAREVAGSFHIFKSAGTTQRELHVDYAGLAAYPASRV